MKSWKKIIAALFVVGVAALLLVYFLVYNKPHRDIENAKPDFVLASAELYEAYTNNRSEAESVYNGKVLLLSGAVDAVEINGDMVVVVFSFESGAFGAEGVRCTMLPGHQKEATGFEIGDFVNIKGLCTGFTDIDVIIEKCSIIE